MKKIFNGFAIVLCIAKLVYSQNIGQAEILVINETSDTISFAMYPISSVFNGTYAGEGNNYKYSFYPSRRNSGGKFWKMNPPAIVGGKTDINPGGYVVLDFDDGDYYNNDTTHIVGGFGYGLWKLELAMSNNGQIVEYCSIDYRDANYTYGGGFTNDLMFILSEFGGVYELEFQFKDGGLPLSIYDARIQSKTIKIWHQVGKYLPGFGYDPKYPGSPSRGQFGIDADSSNTMSLPLKATDFGGTKHINANVIFMNLNIDKNNAELRNQEELVFANSTLKILENIDFRMGNDSKIFLTLQSKFNSAGPGDSKILTVGNNSSIELNGGSVNLNNTRFELASGATSWKGITLTNTGLDTIKNCTFSGADTIIRIQNSDKCFARNKKIITGSRFNNGIVRLSNVFRVLISNDTFATSNSSHYLLTVSNSVHPSDENIFCDEEESPSPMFNLNITGNVFSGGSVQLHLNCLASDYTPFYVFGNTFSGNTNTTGIVCNKVTGDIKYNIVGGTASLSNVILLQSNVNFFGNVFSSGYSANVALNSSSTGTFSPFTSLGNDYWIGGLNIISSEEENNIHYTGASGISLRNGYNCLNIENPYKYHIRGNLKGSCDTSAVYATNNHWSQDPPLHLITCNSTNKDLIYLPDAGGCGYVIDQSGSEIVDREDGVLDTVKISISGDSGGEEDESHYLRSLMFRRNGQTDSARVLLERLLEESANTEIVCRAVEELYLVSELRDTLIVNSQTNSIYNSLKYELENLIQNNPLDSRIVERAYSVLLMCLTKLKDYSHALSGYDNIIENHPDPVRRMTASWDRAAVLLMMNGTGGGEEGSDKSESTSNNEFQDDPIHRIVTNAFRSLESEEKLTTKEEMTFHMIHETSRLKFRPADKRALESRISEDLELIIGSKEINTQEKESPLNSGLIVHPNYPNPFNPVTTVIYELPEPSKVYAKVYDNTGREVEVLFSGFKQKGRHTLTFNGSRLSSGVYYLKIGSEKMFVLRKLILIK